MTQVTAIDPYWLGALWCPYWSSSGSNSQCITAELGSVFYSVKEKNFDERGNRRQADREFSRKAELETEMARQREECVDSVCQCLVTDRYYPFLCPVAFM